MPLPEFTLRQLIEAGVHYGHQSHRWNPLMAPYIHSKKNGIHIIDLTQTVPMLDSALNKVTETVAKGGSILFVGTKRQAQKPVADAAKRSAQFFINQRWLGGTLTNWKTVSNSIQRLNSIDEKLEMGVEGLTKKELLGMRREQAKLQASLGGIREMKGIPDMLFAIDVKKEALAIAEAAKLGIPVVAVVDTNCSPDKIDYMIPGNDDASRAIALYCDLMARAALTGVQKEISARGEDLGAAVDDIGSGPETEAGEVQKVSAERDGNGGKGGSETAAAADQPAVEAETEESAVAEPAAAKSAESEAAETDAPSESQPLKEKAE